MQHLHQLKSDEAFPVHSCSKINIIHCIVPASFIASTCSAYPQATHVAQGGQVSSFGAEHAFVTPEEGLEPYVVTRVQILSLALVVSPRGPATSGGIPRGSATVLRRSGLAQGTHAMRRSTATCRCKHARYAHAIDVMRCRRLVCRKMMPRRRGISDGGCHPGAGCLGCLGVAV